MTTIESLAAALSDLAYEDLPDRTRLAANRCIIDVIGAAAAGHTAPLVATAVHSGLRWAEETFQSGSAGLWFTRQRLSPVGAAFVNSLAASILDVDDGHRAASGHPGAAVIPAVLALGESLGASWGEILLAIVCGYEAGISTAAARESSPSTTGASGRWAAVAVAAAGGRLRRLSREQLAHAVAIAEAQAPNMAAADHAGFAGSYTKEGIPWSVITGLSAIDQALLGWRGYLRGFDNPVVYRPGALPRDTGDGFLIDTTYFKPYACCRWTHSAIDAVLELRCKGLEPGSIERIDVGSFRRALSLENLPRPGDIIAAQFSIPFVLAVAMTYGADALLPMDPQLLEQPEVIALAKRVSLELDPELESCFPAQVPARVTVTTRQGEAITREVRVPRGDPTNPLTDLELTEKAARLCYPLRSTVQTRKFAQELLRPNSPAHAHIPVFAFTQQVL